LDLTLNFSSQQDLPSVGSSGFITKACTAQFLNFTINLFESYFSPAMKYVFPLIAYKLNQFGLDFQSCNTWIIFPEIESSTKILPVGAVYWRMHKPKSYSNTNSSLSGVLEVLFLAVRDTFRNKHYGGNLVEKLKEIARQNNCHVLYVEIGIETPKAKSFWGKYGLKEISLFKLPISQTAFIEHQCLRFNDTVQYIWIDEQYYLQ